MFAKFIDVIFGKTWCIFNFFIFFVESGSSTKPYFFWKRFEEVFEMRLHNEVGSLTWGISVQVREKTNLHLLTAGEGPRLHSGALSGYRPPNSKSPPLCAQAPPITVIEPVAEDSIPRPCSEIYRVLPAFREERKTGVAGRRFGSTRPYLGLRWWGGRIARDAGRAGLRLPGTPGASTSAGTHSSVGVLVSRQASRTVIMKWNDNQI